MRSKDYLLTCLLKTMLYCVAIVVVAQRFSKHAAVLVKKRLIIGFRRCFQPTQRT